jgi:hypothetical protein
MIEPVGAGVPRGLSLSPPTNKKNCYVIYLLATISASRVTPEPTGGGAVFWHMTSQ